MRADSREFSCISPDRVNIETFLLCERKLREPFWKASLRNIYSIYLHYRYQIDPLGRGFRWSGGMQDRRWKIRPGVLKVGHFVRLGSGVHVTYPTVIGDLCMLAEDVHFIGNDHGFDEIGVPMRIAWPKHDTRNVVTIVESDVWIGQRAIIFAGVKIARGSIIAAGSIVTRDVPPYTIVAGVPAKQLRRRFETKADEREHEQTLYG